MSKSTYCMYVYYLDGVGPVDKRPSNNELRHFVENRRKEEGKQRNEEKYHDM